MHPFLDWKILRGTLAPLNQSFVELAAFLAMFLLVALTMAVRSRRQAWRHVVQIVSLILFFFIISSCLGVFGMIRNAIHGIEWAGRDDLQAFYYLAVTVSVMSLTFVFGPVFCGWVCPTGTLQEFVSMLARRPPGAPIPRHRARTVAAIVIAGLVSYAAVVTWVFSTRRPMLEDSATLWATALLVLLLFATLAPDGDRAFRGLRYVSLALVIGSTIAGVDISSPVHFVFTNVHDWASLLSTLVIMGASLGVARAFCRYLCPFGLLCSLAGTQASRHIRLSHRCTRCNACAAVCGTACIERGVIDRTACTMCLACVDVCPEGALEVRDALGLGGAPDPSSQSVARERAA